MEIPYHLRNKSILWVLMENLLHSEQHLMMGPWSTSLIGWCLIKSNINFRRRNLHKKLCAWQTAYSFRRTVHGQEWSWLTTFGQMEHSKYLPAEGHGIYCLGNPCCKLSVQSMNTPPIPSHFTQTTQSQPPSSRMKIWTNYCQPNCY